jgi:predicted acylesterase/phospholipase RssA
MKRGFVLLLIFLTGCMPAWLFPRSRISKVALEEPAKKLAPSIVAVIEPQPPQQAKNVLALSGGGSFGAYTAGVLNGWTRTNTRPQFDVVTGISTGALIAPMAFLGPKYDDDLRRFYTEVERKDVLKFRNFATIPFRDAAASGAPLRRILEANMTDEVLNELAREHQKGRRLYVATMNLDTRRSVVWDIGEMACRQDPNRSALIHDVILASCAIPGVFPPVTLTVEVDGESRRELHVDGGVAGPVFVPPEVVEQAGRDANLYIIIAGKYYPEASRVQPRVLRVLTASGGALMHSQIRRDVANLYHMAELHGVKFHVTSIRQDFISHDNGIEFRPNEMHRLYVEGVRVGVESDWQNHPPERAPGEPSEIRTGPLLRTVGK